MKRKQPLRKRRKVSGPPGPYETRAARRKRLYASQNGRCHSGWGCGQEAAFSCLDEAHLQNLGIGGSRHSTWDSRNAEGNSVMLCRPCHQNQEGIVRAMHAGWMKGLNDWVTPTADNAMEVWAASEGLTKDPCTDPSRP